MVNILKSDIADIISILKNLNFQPKSPESGTKAVLITLGDKINRISRKGVITDDDLKWIRDYCYDIFGFWGNSIPTWLRSVVSKLSSSAKFNAQDLGQTAKEDKINKIALAYKNLTSKFIGWYFEVYLKQQAA